jgi:hypothetical protein
VTYKVFVDDNFHYQDPSERYCAGEYETATEALAKCKRSCGKAWKAAASRE